MNKSARFLIGIFFLAVLIAVGIFWGWRWMQKPTTFPITHVVVEGELAHVPQAALEAAIHSKLSGGFFSVNLSDIRAAVLLQPWIANVSFRRIWPNTLMVQLSEQKPLARFGTDAVLTAEGKLFYPISSSIPENLPIIDGPVEQAAALARFYEEVNTLAKLLDLSVVSLRIDAAQSWYLQLSNTVVVKLSQQNALESFKQFVAIYPKIVQSSKNTVVSVDMRYSDGVAVQFDQLPKIAKK